MNIFNILTSTISRFFYLFLCQLSNCKFFLLANKYLLTYLFKWTSWFFFKLRCQLTCSSCLSELKRLHGKISSRQYKRRIPALPGWKFLYVITRYNLRRICNTARIPAERDIISSRPNGIMQSPPKYWESVLKVLLEASWKWLPVNLIIIRVFPVITTCEGEWCMCI